MEFYDDIPDNRKKIKQKLHQNQPVMGDDINTKLVDKETKSWKTIDAEQKITDEFIYDPERKMTEKEKEKMID